MAKPATRRLARLQARQKAWDSLEDSQRRTFPSRRGFKRPGSNKKPFPAGRGKVHR